MSILMLNIDSQMLKFQLIDVKQTVFKTPCKPQNILPVFSLEKNPMRKKFLKLAKEPSNFCQTKVKAESHSSVPAESLGGRMEIHSQAAA